MGRWRRQDQSPIERILAGQFADGTTGGHRNPCLAVVAGHGFNGAVQQHFLLHADGLQFSQQALGFAEGVAEQQGWPAAITAPPGMDLLGHLFTALPAIDRHPEGGFGDQHIAAHRFKGFAAGVVIPFVIPTDHPHLTL